MTIHVNPRTGSNVNTGDSADAAYSSYWYAKSRADETGETDIKIGGTTLAEPLRDVIELFDEFVQETVNLLQSVDNLHGAEHVQPAALLAGLLDILSAFFGLFFQVFEYVHAKSLLFIEAP